MRWLRIHWYSVGVMAMLAFLGLVSSYWVWSLNDIPEKGGSAIELLEVSVLRFPCSKEHFWGHLVLYRRHDRPDRDIHWGYVCRDWLGQKWVFNTN